MKDIEKVGAMLKQFIEDSMVEANKLDEELVQRKQERDAKDKEIEDVLLQMDYVDMLRLQLQQKLLILEEERATIQLAVEEKENLARRNSLDNLMNIETNDGQELVNEELIDEGK